MGFTHPAAVALSSRYPRLLSQTISKGEIACTYVACIQIQTRDIAILKKLYAFLHYQLDIRYLGCSSYWMQYQQMVYAAYIFVRIFYITLLAWYFWSCKYLLLQKILKLTKVTPLRPQVCTRSVPRVSVVLSVCPALKLFKSNGRATWCVHTYFGVSPVCPIYIFWCIPDVSDNNTMTPRCVGASYSCNYSELSIKAWL